MHATPAGDTHGQAIHAVLAWQGDKPSWICRVTGTTVEVVEKLNITKDLDAFEVYSVIQTHRAEADKNAPRPVNIAPEPNFREANPTYRFIALQHLPIVGQNFYLVSLVLFNDFLSTASIKMMETEFGIFPWHFDLERNQFHLPPGAGQSIFEKEGQIIDYQAFYQTISTESLSRFSYAMEGAINYGRPFKMELLLEIGNGLKWVSFSCRKTWEEHSRGWLSGFIRDVTPEKIKENKEENLDTWLNSGVASLKIIDSDNQIIKQWGNAQAPSGTTFENGKRQSTLFDFRNLPSYTISVDLGAPKLAGKPAGKSDQPANEKTAPELGLTGRSAVEQYIVVAEWIGKHLDAELAAIGTWDEKAFEWMAWWKNPTAYRLAKNTGAWIPPEDWLVEVSSNNPPGFEPGWWPQDLLPFEIESEMGNGWMLLAEPGQNNNTLILAVRGNNSEMIMGKKEIAREGMRALFPSVSSANQTEKELLADLSYKDTLIRELNHRAKNNLAIISSLLKMQAGFSDNSETKEALLITRSRLDTLASLHELLYQHESSGKAIDMHLYMTRLVNGISKGFGSENLEVLLSVDRFDLPVRMATTVGLLVNELATNAFKHAWEPGDPGKLQIDLRKKGSSIQLQISDNGSGMDTSRASGESLGQVLIGEFVAQLSGKMEVNTSGGTTYLIQFQKH